ncbi:MAG: glycosyltransferase family 2 protein [Oscillospiraceae bacterium]|nr:glycosyltransferase family 2 protein [Oscillospiraceae bacterium]
MLPVVYIVVPCYNEKEVLPETSKRLAEKAESLISEGRAESVRIMFVNDGSKDNTWEIICSLHEENSEIFTGLCLSRNRGHQNALLAGITEAAKHADAIISMDADLQDDINAVDEMLDKYNNEGCEVVYGVRNARKTDTFFKRSTARGFYRFMKLMGADIVYDHADYRLLSKRAAQALLEFSEVNLFLRGVVTLVGFKSDKVYYDRGERFAGESKYPLKKMIAFAIDGITSFSVKPLKMITGVGFIMAFIALIFLVKAIVDHYTGNADAGWPSIMCSVWFIGGVQTVCIGIIGEYIGKIYGESKHRPRFIIDKYLG